MVAADLARGNKVAGAIPIEIQEYFFLKEFPNYTLKEMRELSARDYRSLMLISNTMNRVQNQVQESELNKAKRQTPRR
tara:strand:+ start:584 stop:817 length:234 start_codon:yes stop_codon:yes gene_type:complete